MKNAYFVSTQITILFFCWSNFTKLTFALMLRIINVQTKFDGLSEEICHILLSKLCK